MRSIGGNKTLLIQVKSSEKTNRMGEPIQSWVTVYSPKGFLDLITGDSHYNNYSAKIQESTHIFICDYFEFNHRIDEAKAVIDGVDYDIKLVDDPVGLKKHMEIYLAKGAI